MGFFTGAWSLLAWPSGVLGLRIAAGALIVAALYFLYRSTRVGSIELAGRADPAQDPARSAPSNSRFMLAVIAETIVIVIMVIIMLQLHAPQYVIPLVAVIVGAHFFIFIRAGDRAVHIIAGTAGVVVGSPVSYSLPGAYRPCSRAALSVAASR